MQGHRDFAKVYAELVHKNLVGTPAPPPPPPMCNWSGVRLSAGIQEYPPIIGRADNQISVRLSMHIILG